MRPIAGMMCGPLAEVDLASKYSDTIDPRARAAAALATKRFETWPSSKTSPDPEAWIGEPPPTPRITDILLHHPPSSKDRIDQVMRRTLHLAAAQPPPTHPHVRLNTDGICVLLFSDESTTSELAEFLCCVATRMRGRCDRANPRPEDSDHDEVGLYLHLISVVVTQGYVRADRAVGVYDAATGLPLTFERHHPLKISYAAHARHGEPFSLSAATHPPSAGVSSSAAARLNIATESWAVNKFRASRRSQPWST